MSAIHQKWNPVDQQLESPQALAEELCREVRAEKQSGSDRTIRLDDPQEQTDRQGRDFHFVARMRIVTIFMPCVTIADSTFTEDFP